MFDAHPSCKPKMRQSQSQLLLKPHQKQTESALQISLNELNKINSLTKRLHIKCRRIDTQISQYKMKEKPWRQIKLIQVIKQGRNGAIYKARIVQSGKIYALKKIHIIQELVYKKQIQLNRKLKNHFIPLVYDIFQQEDEINIIMQLFDFNLKEYIISYSSNSVHNKVILYQVFRSVHYLHSKRLCHNHIRPQNILLRFDLKTVLSDFSLTQPPNTMLRDEQYYGDNFYRAIELLLGQECTFASDIWALGCVLCEIVLKKPLFAGNNSMDCILSIARVFGTNELTKDSLLSAALKTKIPKIKGKGLLSVFDHQQMQLVDLISQMLKINPKERITAVDALLHPYFNDLRDQFFLKEISKQQINIQGFLSFTREELKDNQRLGTKLIPLWKRKNLKLWNLDRS